jgi:hypothetical protein
VRNLEGKKAPRNTNKMYKKVKKVKGKKGGGENWRKGAASRQTDRQTAWHFLCNEYA